MISSFVRSRILLLVIIIAAAFQFACNPARRLPEGNYLLVKNVLKSDTTILEKDRLLSLSKQKPNRKILGLFRFHLGVYNLGSRGKSSRFKNWLKSIGEEPVILDSSVTQRTRNQMNLFLHKQGFFNSNVIDTIHVRRKKATVIYQLHYGRPYLVRNVTYSTMDPNLVVYLDKLKSKSLIHSGNRYDEETFDKERERITAELKEIGYFYFNKNFITITADTSLNSFQVDLALYINRINENIDPELLGNRTIENHQPQHLRNIYIQTDYNPRDPNGTEIKDTTIYQDYHIVTAGHVHVIHDDVLMSAIFIRKGDLYKQTDIDLTYRRLQDLNVFKFINIRFTDVSDNSVDTVNELDVTIKLTPVVMKDISLETEATNNGGNKGIAGSIGYRNKNMFNGAELFEVKVKLALEAIPVFGESDQKKKFFFFNTFEFGPEANLNIKKFLFFSKSTSRNFRPSTNINIGFNYQTCPDYVRSILNFSPGYVLQLSTRTKLLVNLFNINSVYVNPSTKFQELLDSLNDPRLNYSYQTHLIPSARVTWIYNNQTPEHPSFLYMRLDFETSGLMFQTLAHNTKFGTNENGTNKVAGITFSQYVKPDLDISYHHELDVYNTLVYRTAIGVGIPYGNSTSLPFEKSFFAGGANSLRAWSARTLGPGSYKSTVNIEESGDIRFEANVELRSFLLRFYSSAVLEGAAFIDAGNIWTLKEDPARPGSGWETSKFLSEMGIGSGLGLRFNFTFFILRLDAAVKLRDPSLDLGKRWVYPHQKFGLTDLTFNLAIGYPF